LLINLYKITVLYIYYEENFVLETIKETVPPKYFELNKKVFEMGMNYKET